MQTLKQVLMERDALTSREADIQIAEAKAELMDILESGEQPDDFMMEYFGLEDDYLFDLI
jgi:hypothetical protein